MMIGFRNKAFGMLGKLGNGEEDIKCGETSDFNSFYFFWSEC